MNRAENQTMSLWIDRIFLFISVCVFAWVWGFSFEHVPIIENVLNQRIVLYFLLAAAIALVVLYGMLRAKASGSLNEFFTQHETWLVCLFLLAYFMVMSLSALTRHFVFKSHAFDLAIFDQAIWSLHKGKFLYSSFKGGICLLGDHMSPVLILFSPLYWIWNDVRALLTAQAFVTALCLIPLAAISRKKLGSGLAPVVFSLALFLYLPLRNSVRADFHPEQIANVLIFAAFYFLISNRTKLFWLAVVATVLCKENMYGVAFIFGVYCLFLKKFRSAIILIVFSILLFYVTTQILIPRIAGMDRYFYQGNYSYLFTGSWGAHAPLVVKPLELIEYLYRIYLPLGFFSFLYLPTFLLNVPILLQNILSRNETMHSLAFQYTTGLTPMVFVSAVYGLAEFLSRIKNQLRAKALKPIALTLIAVLSLALAGKPEREHITKFKSLDNSHKAIVRRLVKQIPERFSIVTNDMLAPHLSHRFSIRQFEDFQRLPVSDRYPLEADLVILDRELMQDGRDVLTEAEKVERSGYRTVFERNGFVVLQRHDIPKTLLLN